MENPYNDAEGIYVGVRMRPLNQREIKDSAIKAYRCHSSSNTVYQCTKDGISVDNGYSYDKVFCEQSTTEDVYQHIGKKIVDGVLRGINGTIFACKLSDTFSTCSSY